MKAKKIMSSVCAAALALMMLAGCGSQTPTASSSDEKLDGLLASKEPLDLTIHMHYSNKTVLPDDLPIYKKAAELTNVTLHCTASSTATDSNQVFNTMLVSDQLPDIIHGNKTNTNKAGMDGAMIPLEDLVKKYAPDINSYFEAHPETLRGSLAADGHLYYIPCIYEKGPAMGWFIRQDWLDKLGLSAPKTVDELYTTLKAFREKDPNGNGKKDEVPYFDRHSNVTNLYSLFGVESKTYYALGDDGAVYSPVVSEEYKTAMKEITKWYSEGLIDQEIFSRGKTSREELFGNNTGGSLHDWFSSSMAFNKSIKEPGFKLVTIDPPADVNGKVVNPSPRSTLNGNGWGISKDNKHIAETMRFFNFWFTQTGITLNAYGIEGVDYNIVDGVPEYSDKAKAYELGVPAYTGTFGSREIGVPVSLAAEIKGMSKDAADGFAMYVEKGYTVDEFPKLSFSVEESRVISEKEAAVNTYISESMQNWVMGNKDVDSTWEQYVSDLKNMGLDDLIKVYNAAYVRYMK